MAEGEMKVNQWNEEIVGLYRAAKNLDEELATAHDFCEMEEGEDKKEATCAASSPGSKSPMHPLSPKAILKNTEAASPV